MIDLSEQSSVETLLARTDFGKNCRIRDAYTRQTKEFTLTERYKPASSAESVGRFWLRKFSELMKQGDLNVFERLKAIVRLYEIGLDSARCFVS